jgi:hypothetical protein
MWRLIKETQLYSGAGDAMASGYQTILAYPQGHATMAVLHVVAHTGTGSATFNPYANYDGTSDASSRNAANALNINEPSAAANAESQAVATAAAPGTKRLFVIHSATCAVPTIWPFFAPYLDINVSANTWDSDVVATVNLLLYG